MALKLPNKPSIPPPDNIPENLPADIEESVAGELPTVIPVPLPVNFNPLALNDLMKTGAGAPGATYPEVNNIDLYQKNVGLQLRAAVDGQTIPLKMSIAGLAAMVAQLAAIVAAIPRTPPVPKMPVLPPPPPDQMLPPMSQEDLDDLNPLSDKNLESGSAMIPPPTWQEILDYNLSLTDFRVLVTVQLTYREALMNSWSDAEWAEEWKKVKSSFLQLGYATDIKSNYHRHSNDITYSVPRFIYLTRNPVTIYKNIKDFEFTVPGNKVWHLATSAIQLLSSLQIFFPNMDVPELEGYGYNDCALVVDVNEKVLTNYRKILQIIKLYEIDPDDEDQND